MVYVRGAVLYLRTCYCTLCSLQPVANMHTAASAASAGVLCLLQVRCGQGDRADGVEAAEV